MRLCNQLHRPQRSDRPLAGFDGVIVEIGMDEVVDQLNPALLLHLLDEGPHWFGAAGDKPAEVLLLSGGQGGKVRLKARTANRPAG